MSQLLHIQFRGLDEGADPKMQPSGTLLVADNCRMDKARRLRKRLGSSRRGTDIRGGGSLSAGARLIETGDGGLAVFDGTKTYSYEGTDTDAWRAVDRTPHLMATKRPLIDGAKSAVCVDCTINSNSLITVWLASDPQYAGGGATTNVPIYVQVHDVTTWAVQLPPTLVATAGTYPRVAALTAGVNGIFWTNSSGEIRYRNLDLTTFTLGTDTALISGLVASNVFDVHAANSRFYVVGLLAAGANRVHVEAFSTSYVSSIGPTLTGGAVTGFRAVSINATASENCYVAYTLTSAAEVYLVTLSAAALAVTAGPTLKASVAATQVFAMRDTATTLLFGYALTSLVTMEVTGSTHATTANTTRTTFSIINPTRPWKVNSRWYTSALTFVADGSQVNAPASRVVVEIPLTTYAAAVATHPHVATLENLTGTSFFSSASRWQGSGAAVSSSTAYLPTPYAREINELGDGTLQGANVVALTESGDRCRALRAGSTTLLVGAAPAFYDGLTTCPYGFAHPPEISTAINVGAGSMAAGTYQYAACFVRVGADGILQRSPLSGVRTVSGVALNDAVTLTFDTASLSGKLTETTGYANVACPTYIEIYRTTVGGSILYRLTRAPLYNLVANDPTAATVSFQDTRADANIGGGADLDEQPQVYTNFELDDEPPPAATTGAVHRNRFFLIASDEFTVAASKDASEDITVAPGFNTALTLNFGTRKKALASLDEKLLVFGEDDIDIVHGDGPNANGDDNSWQIQRLQTDVGCTNPRSVVVTPMGVLFECRTQLYLVDRGLTVTRIGTAIEDTLASYPEITSAVLVADESEVRFTCRDVAGTAGVVIVWDYLNKFWCVRRYADGATSNVPFVDAALIDGVYTMLRSTGRVIYENANTHLDPGDVFVQRDVQLAPVSPAGPNAWCRYRRWQVLGTNVSDHDLKLSVASNYATSWAQDNTFAAQTAPTTVGPIQQARITPALQKATAQRLRMQDLTPSSGSVGEGAGPIWEAVTLEYDVLSKTARTSAAEQA